MKRIYKTSLLIALVLCMALMAGCGGSEAAKTDVTNSKTEAAATVSTDREAVTAGGGVILLSINPEIRISYDENGLVTEAAGVNADGIAVVSTAGELTGKTCNEAIKLLVAEIHKGGYFDVEIEGKDKNLLVKFEEGSVYPNKGFAEDIVAGVPEQIAGYGVDSTPVTVPTEALDEKGYIGIEAAKQIVLDQLGYTEESLVNKEYGLDDGKYEFEFTVEGLEYEFEIDAITGKIVEVETERDDDIPSVSTPQDYIGWDAAKAIAFEYLGIAEADCTHLEYDLDDGRYQIEFNYDGKEYEVKINAVTGEVIRAETEPDDNLPANTNTDYIGWDAAKAIAFEHLGIAEADCTHLEYDLDDGRYQIEFNYDGKEYEVKINAATGEIVKVEDEYDD